MKVSSIVTRATQRTLGTAVLIASVLMSTFSAKAAEVWHSGYVTQVYPMDNGDFVIIFSADSPSCTYPNSPHYYKVAVGQNGVTVEGAKKLYAVALLAFAMGKMLDFSFDNSTQSCYINRASVH